MSNTIPQEEKAELLDRAVINSTPEELTRIFKELGDIEMTARALGLACRFRGLDIVKTLVELGATFDFPNTEAVENRYHCYTGTKWANYRTNYSLYLLSITKQVKGACCFKGTKFLKKIAREDKTFFKLLSDGERLEILDHFCENAARIGFSPDEMLYFAILGRDELIADELQKRGVKLSETRVKYITEGGAITDGYWYEWTAILDKMSDEDFLPVLKRLAPELGGKKFHCTAKLFRSLKKHFTTAANLEFIRDNFKLEKINKTDVVRGVINNNSADSLPMIEQLGWLADPKRRDEMIEYAQKLNRVECVAWLLDFKNRTADFAAERIKAERKMTRELNASPTSIAVMKKTWGYRKEEHGGLTITSYKGEAKEVTIPETIGKGVVTAIGKGAFAGGSGLCAGRVVTYATFEQQTARRLIQRVAIPNTVTEIDNGAFADMTALLEINIPESVETIGEVAFYQCPNLPRIVIPKSVKFIGEYAFRKCDKLTVIVEKGSYAEKYCRENDVKYSFK